MLNNKLVFILLALICFNCKSNKEEQQNITYSDVVSVAAMKDVMWKGELYGKIQLDTINPKKGLYGLGPEAYLRGEIVINNGKTYVSRVLTDSTMTVKEIKNAKAPFFVYANVNDWNKIKLPSSVKSIKELEAFIDSKTKDKKRPFAFKLEGSVSKAIIHIQNLPKETRVSSPKEAHQGQTNYTLENENTEIIGFFSTQHQGVFTHHDSFLHMHLITKNEKKMGHLDDVIFNEMSLLLPKS
ncbi:acetolactate decarboxylase [Winogradskyella sp.]|jgi:acetolactate decarboxylase|uniref:acetolactate decarboxylase n=1 Tax=Winogradskyella sp. TaxID=1883156 RepID=UPI0025DF4ABA|nr:acetolactate decarboxylase [Winogradskyella sp.]MCT4630843.1 acetolactate decarboxylase [Winogradskyella sp.]